MKIYFTALLMLCLKFSFSQTKTVFGRVTADSLGLAQVSVQIAALKTGVKTDSTGNFVFKNIKIGSYILKLSAVGYQTQIKKIQVNDSTNSAIEIALKPQSEDLKEIVVSGTLKAVRKLDSPVPVEIYSASFLRKNPTSSVFDGMQHVNGVRPQLNCNVCNTGDIHINGLEGPYTMVLIDGMPIVSGLSTVYGLSGIPASLIEQVEVVKGPASSLYGSEAIGGLINVITKKPEQTALLSADVFSTSWQEHNADLGLKVNVGKTVTALTGVNYFRYNQLIDNNLDGFTDMTLQNRVSLFQKWNFNRKDNRIFNLAGRFLYEDRWGGQTTWNKGLRGSYDIYAESILTKRWELMGTYQLPIKEKMFLAFSYNNHNQNSVYGTDWFLANQQIAFGQLTWDKKLHKHDLLLGTALRYTFYNDNTPATVKADDILLPGVFIQDEIKLADDHKMLLGMRYDYHSVHGNIFTPRLAYKWNLTSKDIFRLNAGTGFRVVNIFTEDHAALTGAREVLIKGALNPERSYNINLNYVKKLYDRNGNKFNIDLSSWYTYFDNRITADYDTNPQQIIYGNLDGYAITRGVSANLDFMFTNGLSILLGGSLLDVKNIERNKSGDMVAIRPVKSERWMGTWAISYKIKPLNLSLDYTGSIYGPMRLALLSDLDPRPDNSPVWSIQNIQFTYKTKRNYEIFGGIKNLLNWTISKNIAGGTAIARSFDPYDKSVQYDSNGNIVSETNVSQNDPRYNPYALKFDPDGYSYGPNQGIRAFLGVRLSLY